MITDARIFRQQEAARLALDAEAEKLEAERNRLLQVVEKQRQMLRNRDARNLA